MTAPTKLQSQLKRFFSLIIATTSFSLFIALLIPGYYLIDLKGMDNFYLVMVFWLITCYGIDKFYDAGISGGYLGRW